jgi:hypothetical protein
MKEYPRLSPAATSYFFGYFSGAGERARSRVGVFSLPSPRLLKVPDMVLY